MSDDVIVTPQERRLLSIEERLVFLERRMTIITDLIADLHDLIKLNEKVSALERLKPLSPEEGPV